jgi:hypothetical protein
VTFALVAVLSCAGCGGQIAGQSASTTPATQAAAPPSSTTATAPSTTTSKRAARRRSPSSANGSTTTGQPRATTQPPASTTPVTTTPPSATAKHTTQTTPKPAPATGTPIDETAQLTLVSKPSATEYTQHGTVTGTYGGEMTLTAKITNDGISVRFTVTTPDGTVTGHGLAIVHITGAALEPITGTAAITGGTGRFAGAHGSGMKVRGRVALDASRGVVHLMGTMLL